MSFSIDGKQFESSRIDTEVAAGTVEEWTINNTSTMDHPFHLHVWPMQLVEINGAAVSAVEYRDVVPVPANGRPSSVSPLRPSPARRFTTATSSTTRTKA